MQFMTVASKLALVQLMDRGVMNANQMAQVFNMPPVPGGDVYRLWQNPKDTHGGNRPQKARFRRKRVLVMKIDDVPRAPGIYRITCNENKRVYVGQSTNMRDRAGYHIRHLKRGSHTNKHLQNAWNKYGEGSFVIDVLERCPKSFDVLNEREIYWINKLDALARGRGFNIATGGSNGYSLGGMPEGERAAILEKNRRKNTRAQNREARPQLRQANDGRTKGEAEPSAQGVLQAPPTPKQRAEDERRADREVAHCE